MAGKLYGWGDNYFGQLGLGNNAARFSPTRVGSDEGYTKIAVAVHTLVIKDGKLYASGYNSNGQLGTGNKTNRNTFIQIGSDNNWKAVFANSKYSLALKTDGTLWGWGDNSNYNMGLGETDDPLTPTQIGTDTWKTIAAGTYHCLGIKTDGTLWSWGRNFGGGLGVSSNTNLVHQYPTQVGSSNNWKQVGASVDTSIAVKTDGTLWAWGYKATDNLTYYTPTKVGTDTDWKFSVSGAGFYFAIKNNGSLWSWGNNSGGATGLGLTTGVTVYPTQIGSSTWKHVDCDGPWGISAIKTDGTLWNWGVGFPTPPSNYTSSSTPVQIGSDSNWNLCFAGDNYFIAIGDGVDENPDAPVIDDIKVFNPTINPKIGDQLSATYSETGGGIPSFQWKRKKPTESGYVNIPGATDSTYIIGEDDIGYEIIVEITIENNFGSDISVSPATGAVIQTFSTETWRFLFHEINGDTIGEFTDLHNVKLDVGLNKNPSLSFDTTLQSNLGKLLADSLNETDPVMLVSAWRYDPYDEVYKVQFSGPIFTIEETGSDDNPSIGVTAVGSYYRLTKRVANNEANQGRRQSGLSPTLDTLQLLVTDNTGNRVMVYDAKTGAYVTKWGTAGSGNGQFSDINGIAVGPNNYVYVADSGNDRIQKFALDGTYISKWNTVEDGSSFLDNPIDVAVDQASGDVWVADRGNKQVVKYDSDGNYLFKVDPVTGFPMDNLRGIFVDYEGNAYVSDETNLTTNPNNQGVYKITPTGQVIVETTGIINSFQKKFALDNSGQAYWVNGAGQLRKGPGRPKLTSKASTMQTSSIGQSVAVGSDKAVYFLESNNTDTSRVKKYNPAQNTTKTIGAYGTANGETRNAKGIALARSGSRDAIEIIDEIIEESNNRDGHSWINVPDTQGSTAKIFIQPGSLGGFRSISSIIEEFNQYYEWRLIPKFEEEGGNLILGEWYADAVLGTNKATNGSVIFEYGFGKLNVDSYTIKKSIEGLANRINYPAADQKPYNTSSISPDSITAIGLFEDSVSGNVLSVDLRKQVTDLHLFYRVYPRRLVEIQPTRSDQSGPNNTRVPIPLIEYLPGDIIGLEIKENDDQRVPASEARIYDMTVEIDSEGRETCSLNLYLEEG